MRDMVQALSRIIKMRHSRKNQRKALPTTVEEVSIDMDQSEIHTLTAAHLRGESIDSTTDPPED